MTGASFTPDRWRRIEELFHSALELPVEHRTAFLHQSCGGDEHLRREIETLLAADHEESPLIALIVDDTTAHLLEDGNSGSE
jgi:hypothetical protein